MRPWRLSLRIKVILLLGLLVAAAAIALSLRTGPPGRLDGWLAILAFFLSALAAMLILAVSRESVVMAGRRRRQVHRPDLFSGRFLIPHQLPVRLRQFRGREADLKALTDDYGRQSRDAVRTSQREHVEAGRRRGQTPGEDPPTGPAILLVEGMPGVGKTALAQELAHRMAPDFRDGQLYANLGFAGGRRPPADVLHDFLAAFGVMGHELPMDITERVKLFRSLTVGKRVLVVLDAARGYDQIRPLLPTGEHCAVIVTSRSSIGPALGVVAHVLDPPDTTDALDILTAFSLADPIEAAVEAAEVVDYAGALPLALRSAGEQIADGRFTMRTLAAKLIKPGERLEAFGYRARNIRERIESEYVRLSPQEQRALGLLSSIESPTFGPWVLAPLMHINELDAERLVARLASYHLVGVTGRKNDTGRERYRLHPLVWLVARQKYHAEASPAARGEASRRLYEAYLGAVGIVLGRDNPTLDREGRWRSPWARFEDVWVPHVRARQNHWVRAEYCTLVHTIRFAYREKAWGLCWRVAARLGACVTTELPAAESMAAFDDALDAANREPTRLGHIEVLLARGSFLIAVERYAEAFDNLRNALEATDAAAKDLGPLQARRLWASAHRRKAEAWMQLGAYASAAGELKVALDAVRGFGSDKVMASEVERLGLLTAESETWCDPAKWRNREPYEQADRSARDDAVKFRAVLGLAEQAQRDRDWLAALRYLRRAYDQNYGDDRRIANVQYRMARLFLQQSGSVLDEERINLGRRAVGYAGDAIRIFGRMENQVGVMRAKVLLARALRVADRREAAVRLADGLDVDMLDLDAADPARAALRARVLRCQGEALMDTDDYQGAYNKFADAFGRYDRAGDWHTAGYIALSLAAAARAGDLEVGQALYTLDWAADKFSMAGDSHADNSVRQEKTRIARSKGMPVFQVWP
jgi:tetratricopeptide (TPR) repeat protein